MKAGLCVALEFASSLFGRPCGQIIVARDRRA